MAFFAPRPALAAAFFFAGAGFDLAPFAIPNNAAIPIALPRDAAAFFTIILYLYLTLLSLGFFFLSAADALRFEDARISPADLTAMLAVPRS
jgi:hypothetical protein